MNRFVYILPVIAVGCGYRIFLDHRRKKHIVSRLRSRPQLTDEEFGARYFPVEQAQIAAQVRQLLGRHLPFPLAGLHPDDTFIDDLQIATFSRTAMVEFLMNVEVCFDVELRHRQDTVIRTFGELVEAVARGLKCT